MYGFKVVGLQGISAATEAGISERVKLVDFIKDNKVKAILLNHVSGMIKVLPRIQVIIGGELFSDAMNWRIRNSEWDQYDLGTYEGMIKHNINTIVEALK